MASIGSRGEQAILGPPQLSAQGISHRALLQELDTPTTYSSRQYCSRACERKGKGTQTEGGKLRWIPEELRP